MNKNWTKNQREAQKVSKKDEKIIFKERRKEDLLAKQKIGSSSENK
jgi:hypothetical protein